MSALLAREEPVFVGIDVGTTKVCVLVGEVDANGHLKVLGVGAVPSQGMRKGGVVDLDAVTRSIQAAKDKAERTSGYEIGSALVSLSGKQIACMNSTGMAGVAGRTIDMDDVARALSAARSVATPYNRSIIHVIPRGYVVDGQDGIKSAIGMHGYRLEVEAHVVTANTTALKNLEQCVEAADMAVDGWVTSSLAAASMVLTETEREMGVVVCDIGGGTTDLAIFIEGAVWHTAVIPVGGEHLTNDIAQVLHLPQETAESVKRRHGHAQPSAIETNDAFAVRPFGEDRSVQIRRQDLAEILEPRVEELFTLVRQEVKRSGYDGLLPAGLVLTGGTSLLPGIREVAADVMRLPVRFAQPEDIRGLVDRLRSPVFSTSIGLLRWAQMQSGEEEYIRSGWPKFSFGAAADFIRRLLPG
ncbi:MAG: cell division protein FtsA [Anaerolineales bacterium]|nr:cell division protein FtsA [Anaerolineales bacterium]